MEQHIYNLMKAVSSIYNRWATLDEVRLMYCRNYTEDEFINAKNELLNLNYIEIRMQDSEQIILPTTLGEMKYSNETDERKYTHAHNTTIHQNIVVSGDVINSGIGADIVVKSNLDNNRVIFEKRQPQDTMSLKPKSLFRKLLAFFMEKIVWVVFLGVIGGVITYVITKGR